MTTVQPIQFIAGFLLLGLIYGCFCFSGWPVNPAQAQNGQLEEISSLSTGGRFYLDKSSFQSAGGGKLRYTVIGQNGPQDPNNTSQRISVNEIDCTTGQLRSPIESWSEDSQGNISDRLPGPQGPVTVSNRTKLHGMLKDACAANLPDTQGDW